MRRPSLWRYIRISHAGCVSPSDARDCIAQPAQRAPQPATSPESRQPSGRRSSWQQPKRRAIGNVERPAPSDLAGEAMRQQIASSLRAPAGSDDARNAPADKDLPSLAQMTTPRDGLPAPLLQGPCNAVCSPTCPGKPRQLRAPAAHQRALDNSSTRCHRFQQDAPSVPITGAAVATSNGGFTAYFGSGVPSPLWFPLRFGVRDGQKHLPDPHTPATADGPDESTITAKDAIPTSHGARPLERLACAPTLLRVLSALAARMIACYDFGTF